MSVHLRNEHQQLGSFPVQNEQWYACTKNLNLDQEIFSFLYTNPKEIFLFVSTTEIVMSKKEQTTCNVHVIWKVLNPCVVCTHPSTENFVLSGCYCVCSTEENDCILRLAGRKLPAEQREEQFDGGGSSVLCSLHFSSPRWQSRLMHIKKNDASVNKALLRFQMSKPQKLSRTHNALVSHWATLSLSLSSGACVCLRVFFGNDGSKTDAKMSERCITEIKWTSPGWIAPRVFIIGEKSGEQKPLDYIPRTDTLCSEN
jgi:hypothetical protein